MAWDEDPPRVKPERVHSCQAGEWLRQATGDVQAAEAKQALWGHAVTRVDYASGRWWAHNEEYSSVICFCPWCGAELATALTA